MAESNKSLPLARLHDHCTVAGGERRLCSNIFLLYGPTLGQAPSSCCYYVLRTFYASSHWSLTMIIPAFQKRILRHTDIKQCCQCHTSRKHSSWDLNLGGGSPTKLNYYQKNLCRITMKEQGQWTKIWNFLRRSVGVDLKRWPWKRILSSFLSFFPFCLLSIF